MIDKNVAKDERTFIITSGPFPVNSDFRAHNTRVHAYFNAVMAHPSAQTKNETGEVRARVKSY